MNRSRVGLALLMAALAAPLATQLAGCDRFAAFGGDESEGAAASFELDPRLLPRKGPACTETMAVGGLVSGDQTLHKGGCYVVEHDLLITGNLAIEEGVRIGVADGKSIDVADGATVAAIGTEEEPVEIFGSTPDASTWVGIHFGDGSRGVIEHAVIQGAGSEPHCCEVMGPAAVLVEPDATLTMSDTSIMDSNGDGVACIPRPTPSQLAAGLAGDNCKDVEEPPTKNILDKPLDTDPRDEGLREGVFTDGGGEACLPGQTKCQGDDMVFCIGGAYQVVKSCSQNVDSGKTMCTTYDGNAVCELPRAVVCNQFYEDLRSGLLDDDWNPNTRCKAPTSCEEAPTVGCLVTNTHSVGQTFTGNGNRLIRYQLYEDSSPTLTSINTGIWARLVTKGEYTLRVYRGSCGEPVAKSTEPALRTDIIHVWEPEAWIAEDPNFTYEALGVDDVIKEWADNSYWITFEVVKVGGDCDEPWSLTIATNPCPSEHSPVDGNCRPEDLLDFEALVGL